MIVSKKNRLFFLGFILLISACQKEEIAIEKRPPGNFISNSVGIGELYENQIYFDLETNSIISTNKKTAWDLAFESAVDGWHITLNSGRGMAVSKSDLDFGELTTIAEANWNWDVPSGNLDSTAFGDWRTEFPVYLIDMGYDEFGTQLGYKKIQVLSFTDEEFTFIEGNLTDLTGTIINLEKNEINRLTYYRFAEGAVTIAPPNADYDLVFTQYTHIFHEPLTPYLVTGVLLNRYQTNGLYFTDKPFEEILRADVESLELQSNLNTIGYDWKFYNFDEGQYVVDPTQVFIIQTNEGFYYKFRFTGFYNELGIKGYPSFEYQVL